MQSGNLARGHCGRRVGLSETGSCATRTCNARSAKLNRYCLSKTIVVAIGLPSAFVPLPVCVKVLPSLEMTFCPVAWYFPPVFFTSQLVVFASIRLTEIL